MQKKIAFDKRISQGNFWTSYVILSLSVFFPVQNDERYACSTSIRKHGQRKFVTEFFLCVSYRLRIFPQIWSLTKVSLEIWKWTWNELTPLRNWLLERWIFCHNDVSLYRVSQKCIAIWCS